MDLQFEKRTLPCMEQVLWDTQTAELTQELRLPEGMPDVGQVVSCWAMPVIRGKEWRNDRISVNGGVMCWVLYTPEEEGTPQSMAAWMPYQMKWDIPPTRHDGIMIAQPFIRSADARSLSSRKLMLRANLGMQLFAMTPGEVQVYTPENLPQDVQVLKKIYPMLLPVEAGEKAFQIEEEIQWPGNLPQPEQIVRYQLQPNLAEWKIMTDKAVFRGTGYLHVLYRGADGQLHTWDYEVPISQYADLDKEYESDAEVAVLPVVTNLELDLVEGQLRLKAGLTGQYMVYERPMVEIVEDAYSTTRKVETKMEALYMPALLDSLENTMRVEQAVDFDGGNVIDLAFYPDAPQQLTTKEGAEIHLPGVFDLLIRNTAGQPEGIHAYWEEMTTVSAAPDSGVQTTVLPNGVPTAMTSSGGVAMQADMDIRHRVTCNGSIPAVIGLDLGEEVPKDPQRPSLILRRAGEECLWDIAKSTGTTVDAIRKANDLEAEPEKDRMLIIPIP